MTDNTLVRVTRSRSKLLEMTPSQQISPSKPHIELRSSFELNQQKALQKKATDVNRPDSEYKETNGGFVLKFNPGVYEEVRKLLDIKLETEYKPSKQIILDAKEFHHTITYRIKNITGPNYTVNFYLTTSKMMINGPDAPEFIVLLKEIVESVDKTTATEINNIITRHVNQMTTRTTRRSARTSKPTEKAKQLQDRKNSKKDHCDEDRTVPALMPSILIPPQDAHYAALSITDTDLGSRRSSAQFSDWLWPWTLLQHRYRA